MRVRTHIVVAALAALSFGVLVSACGSDEEIAAARASQPRFDRSNFANPASAKNRWFPLTPGYQSVTPGEVNRGQPAPPAPPRLHGHRRHKVIDGVRTVLVLDQDFDGGQIAEQALDYLAEDERGNVWYLGSYTETYEGGRFVNANDGWLDGRQGRQGRDPTCRPTPGAG